MLCYAVLCCAVQALSAAIWLDAGNAPLYANRSVALHRLGQCAAALDDAEASVRCDAGYAPAYERQGRALLGLGRRAHSMYEVACSV